MKKTESMPAVFRAYRNEQPSLPDVVDLPSEVFQTALDLRERTHQDVREYSTFFRFSRGQMKRSRVRRGTLNASTSSVVDLLRLAVVPSMKLHSHPHYSVETADLLVSSARLLSGSKRKHKTGVRINVPEEVDSFYQQVQKDTLFVPSPRDVAQFLTTNLSSSLIVSEDGTVLMVKDFPLTNGWDKTGGRLFGDIKKRIGFYTDCSTALVHDVDARQKMLKALAASIHPIGAVYFSDGYDQSTLQRIPPDLTGIMDSSPQFKGR